ncbi:hypothetical protein V495_01017 [Pseudogymnoascus sp. VKM F-4514 (FW-929)]|nr:hypothetical protein V495_01017 [Pseudogymnoascus sp. VKM F-4514 (FW-929)]
MSLAQHVTSVEGIDRQPFEPLPVEGPETSQVVRRVLSYDAFPPSKAEDLTHHAAAYNVSTAKRAAQVSITVLACWLASGIVFGYAALKPILISEGVYRELCTDEELKEGVHVCLEQDIRLNFFFTLASITTNLSALPVGAILDRFGPRVCGIAGGISLAAGSILMSYAFGIPEFDGYLLANFFLALGGTFIFVPSFQIANAFPKYSGLIVAIITGSFDASASVFLFYRLAYEATHHAFGPDRFFLSYTLVPILIILSQLTVMPSQSYHTIPQLERKMEKAQDATRDVHTSDDEVGSGAELTRIRSAREDTRLSKIQKLDDLMGDEDERQQKAEREEERKVTSAVWGALHGKSALEQIRTPWFILITLLTALQMLRMNYFIATIRSQYGYMLDSESRARDINHFFDVALPIGGVISTPFIGICLDRLSVPAVLGIMVGLISIVGVLNAIPFEWAAYSTVCLFVILRPFYYSAMSDYAAKVFGFATFGKVYGAIIFLSGISIFSQYGIEALTAGPFDGNPTPVNVAMAGAGFVVGSVLVIFVWQKGRVLKPTLLSEEEQGERQRLIPEEPEEY